MFDQGGRDPRVEPAFRCGGALHQRHPTRRASTQICAKDSRIPLEWFRNCGLSA